VAPVATRRRWPAVLAAAVLTAAGLALAAPASAAVTTGAGPAEPPATLTVGRLTLTRCAVVPGAYCGHLAQPWDRAGLYRGTLSVGFAFVPAADRSRPALGTVVPQEGGPGYSTTGSGSLYAAMYGSLLARRNLLLVDQRGTGLTAVVDCPTLNTLVGAYDVAAAACAARLGARSDLFGTPSAADDLAAVITALGVGPVDLYGDSYGTFFAQVFSGRHPALLRSVVLDSAYPPTGETAWYPTQTAAMTSSLDKVCARTPSCVAVGGPSPTQLLAAVLARVRLAPYRGVGYDAEGVRHNVVVDAEALVSVAFGATYGPAWYRELPAALRSALAANTAALIRLVAEAVYPSYPTDLASYTEGMDAATSCQVYPQLYDMAAPPARRLVEYRAAVRAQQRSNPGVYAPFTIAEYLASGWEEQDWCLRWPVASAAHPAGPPAPPSGHYPSVPVLVLSGELDSITTPAEGDLVTAQFPRAVHVMIANSFHVTAEGDSDGCAVSIVRAFVADPSAGLTRSVLACAARVPPLRAAPTYVTTFVQMPSAVTCPGASTSLVGLKAADTAAQTVADVIDRWSNNFLGSGVGLYGGTWSYTGDAVTRFHLVGVRLTADLAVSGTVVWARYAHTVRVDLQIRQVTAAGAPRPGGITGSVRAGWQTRARDAIAAIGGQLDGQRLCASMPAP
jgi:pimeloyl-ACP methyl ester carboxylesterase